MRRTISLACIVALLFALFSLPVGAELLPTPIPTESAWTAPVYEELKAGDSGEAVLALQERLLELGYQIGTADGQFGKKTESAIKQVQILAGLDVTGVADQATQEVIWSEDTGLAVLIAQPTPEPSPEPEPMDVGSDYIANKNTKKFHETWCSSVDQMKEKNKWYFTGSRETLIRKGYVPCKRCDP